MIFNKQKKASTLMELLIFIVGVTALITFWSTFKKFGNTVERALDVTDTTLGVGLTVVSEVANHTSDSIRTHGKKVSIYKKFPQDLQQSLPYFLIHHPFQLLKYHPKLLPFLRPDRHFLLVQNNLYTACFL